MNSEIIELEKKLSSVGQKKIDNLRQQQYENAAHHREEENLLFATLEKLTDSKYLKENWNVIKVNEGYYEYPSGITDDKTAISIINTNQSYWKECIDKKTQ